MRRVKAPLKKNWPLGPERKDDHPDAAHQTRPPLLIERTLGERLNHSSKRWPPGAATILAS